MSDSRAGRTARAHDQGYRQSRLRITQIMSRSTLTIQGVDVFIEGEGPDTLVMIHGWPDTHHLWDSSVQALEAVFPLCAFHAAGLRSRKAATCHLVGANDGADS
jgi:pimeloyl-ACP methyl ester carboxylesterase